MTPPPTNPLSLNRPPLSHRGLRGASTRLARGFTLIELLSATAVLMMIVLVLASAMNQALGVWSRNEAKRELREKARAAISVIASELKQAVLPVGNQDQLGLVINPPGISDTFKKRDAIFFQAPIATERSMGDLATVGYFVRKDAATGSVPKLCRLFINPNDADYKATETGLAWLNEALLDKKALADEANYLPGLFLENVAGMWIQAYSDSTNLYTAYDSRIEKKLPARIEITLVLIDSGLATRVKNGQITLPNASHSTPGAYLDALPQNAKANVEAVTVTIPFAF